MYDTYTYSKLTEDYDFMYDILFGMTDWVQKCTEYEMESTRHRGKLKRTARQVVQRLSNT